MDYNNKNWKVINGFSKYKINDCGEIYSEYKKDLMKPFHHAKGYLRIRLTNDSGVGKHKFIHVLVMENFVSEKPFPEAQVNHKDGDKTNNNVDNLEWVTGTENIRHFAKMNPDKVEEKRQAMSVIGKKYGGTIGTNLTKKPVVQIDKNNNNLIALYESAREAERHTNVSYKEISRLCNKTRNITENTQYAWRFADKEGATTILKGSKVENKLPPEAPDILFKDDDIV